MTLKRRPPPLTIIPDTSILWTHDKAHAVAPEFEDFWKSHAPRMDLQLILPEVVRGELLFQQTTSALNALDKVEEQYDHIRRVTEREYSYRLTPASVRTAVRERFDRWVRSKGAEVEPTPVDKIDWKKIVEQSIWRLPPFLFDPKKADVEKGFRDALILETLIHYCEHRSDGKSSVAFVSSDRLLRETAEGRLEDRNCSFYETLEELTSYIRLTEEELTDQFVSAIRARARAKFWTKGDPDSLYHSENVYNRIREEHAEQFHPTDGSWADLLGGSSGDSLASWQSTEKPRIFLGNPQFHELEGSRRFHWKSPITIVQSFEREVDTGELRMLFGSSDERLLVAQFDVYWSADVRSNQAFYDIVLERIEAVDRSFSSPTEDDRIRYGLPGSREKGD